MAFKISHRMKRRLFLIAITALVAATVAEESRRFIADQIWTDDAAPWEKVTAVYYPDRQNTKDVRVSDPSFDDVAQCRDHIAKQAAKNGDTDLQKGRSECAIGFYRDGAGNGSYRLIIE